MPSADVFFNSSKKVFAHYFAPFPLSIDNKDPSADYYNANYLNPNGESGKWLKQGGYLRQRPLGVVPSAVATFRQHNQEAEIQRAVARGITGFTFDVMSLDQVTNANSELNTMLKAAQAVEPRFKIVVMPDMSALRTNSAVSSIVVQIIELAAKSPAAYRLSDGRLVVSAFDAEIQTPAWWQAVIQQVNNAGIDIAFVPTFSNWEDNAQAFAGLTYGFADWGSATPTGGAARMSVPAQVHAQYQKIYMMPIDPQQFRPKNYLYWEAGNSASFRNAWMSAINGQSDWVQIVTWNDFSESGEISPYTDATLRTDIGTGFYDMNGFYAAWFATGQQPAITHDVAYWFYRREPTTAAGSQQSQLDRIGGGTATDNVEVVAFLTDAATIKIQIGSSVYTQSFPAGLQSYSVPASPGQPQITIIRADQTVFSFAPGISIAGASGLASGVLDMTYWSGSASQSGTCSL